SSTDLDDALIDLQGLDHLRDGVLELRPHEPAEGWPGRAYPCGARVALFLQPVGEGAEQEPVAGAGLEGGDEVGFAVHGDARSRSEAETKNTEETSSPPCSIVSAIRPHLSAAGSGTPAGSPSRRPTPARS